MKSITITDSQVGTITLNYSIYLGKAEIYSAEFTNRRGDRVTGGKALVAAILAEHAEQVKAKLK